MSVKVNFKRCNAATTTTPILVPLSRLARVGNFCFNLLSLFHSIVRILSFQAISFQILLYALFPRFTYSTLLPFKFHNFTFLGVDVSTILPQTALNNHTFDLHFNTHLILNNSRFPINQSHPTHHPDHSMLHPMQPRLIRNSKFPRLITVQHNSSNKINPAASQLTHHSLNFFHALPILELTASDAPPLQLIISPK